jgi:hypothetical protein
MTRKAGLRGLRPSPPIPELRLSKFLTAPLPAPPPAADVSNGVTDWGMLGNDTYGDCGVAAYGHYLMAQAATNGVYEPGFAVPTTANIESLYFAYGIAQGEPGPNPDQGVDNATFLKYLYDQALIEGFAQLDHTNSAEVQSAMIAFQGVFTGVQLDDDAESDFEAEPQIPWGSSPGDVPDPNDGHDTLLVYFDPTGGKLITWGDAQPFVLEFEQQNITDQWVIFTKELAERAGVDITACQAAIEGWGGVISPPSPPAPPSPAPELHSRIDEVFSYALRMAHEIIDDVTGKL